MNTEHPPLAPAETHALHAFVEGRVQGVGFRMFVLRTAVALDLCGWVRNRANGQVEVWAEGSPSNVSSLLNQLKQGPPAAVVTHVDFQWVNATGEYQSFILRSTR